MRDKYLAANGGIGTYTTTAPVGENSVWTKQSGSGGGGEGGTFTLTGIPSQFNGKYAYLMAGEDVSINGFQSINISENTFTLCLISNGSVSIPLWTSNNSSIVRYSGNHTAYVVVALFNTQTLTVTDDSPPPTIGVIDFSSVTFKNGSATRSWSQGEAQMP